MAEEEQTGGDMKQYYLLGFVVLVAVVVAGYMLRPKTSPATQSPVTQEAMLPTPTPGPITGLGCDSQYYNPKIGFPEYYLSVDGGDVSEAKTVNCEFTVSVDDKVVATEKASSPLTDKPQRGGSTFRCTTKALALTPNVPTIVDVVLTDNLKESATCSASFLLPAP